MSDNLYNRFSELTGTKFVGSEMFKFNDLDILKAYLRGKIRLDASTSLEAAGDKAELDHIFSVISHKEGRQNYDAEHLGRILGAPRATEPGTVALPSRFRRGIQALRDFLPFGKVVPEAVSKPIAEAAPVIIDTPVAAIPAPTQAAVAEIVEEALPSNFSYKLTRREPFPVRMGYMLDDARVAVSNARKNIGSAWRNAGGYIVDAPRAVASNIGNRIDNTLLSKGNTFRSNLYIDFKALTGAEFIKGFDDKSPQAIEAILEGAKANFSGVEGGEAKIARLEEIAAALATDEGRNAYLKPRMAHPTSRLAMRMEENVNGVTARASENVKGAAANARAALPSVNVKATKASLALAMAEPVGVPTPATAMRGTPLEGGPNHIILKPADIPKLPHTPIPNTPRPSVAVHPLPASAPAVILDAAHTAPLAAEAAAEIAVTNNAKRSIFDRIKGGVDRMKGWRPFSKKAEAAIEPMAAAAEAATTIIDTPPVVAAESAAVMPTATGNAVRSPEEMAAIKAKVRESFNLPSASPKIERAAARANFFEKFTTPIASLFSSSKPHKVLGVARNANNAEIMTAYNAKLEALSGKRMDSPRAQWELNRLEKAHDRICNRALEVVKKVAAPMEAPVSYSAGWSGAAIEHSPLRGKLLLAGGVVAAAAVGYLSNRKTEKYPMKPLLNQGPVNWVEATQQPSLGVDMQR